MNIVIREMREKDLDKIMEVEKGAFSIPWSRESFLMEITKNQLAKYVIAEVNGIPVGYGGIWLILDEGHITNIAVDKNHRRQGIGEKILNELIKICRELEIIAITLEVRQDNEPAKSLYKKYDFLEYGIRADYYGKENGDAIIMWKNLKK